MKKVYFSEYCNHNGITPVFDDEEGEYRYQLTIPFNFRENNKHAIVIMKNPSNAGRKDMHGNYLSDDTVYRILDYLYKHENKYSKVTIFNLYPHICGESKKIKEIIKTNSGKSFIKKNDDFVKGYLKNFTEDEDYQIIAGWGAHSNITESDYKKRIRDFFQILKDKEVYRVGPMVGKNKQYPGHGKYWYDYEELLLYPCTAIC